MTPFYRSLLLEQLDLAVRYRLTLLLAPTGFGKSCLLREWAGGLGCRVGWIDLDASMNEPAQFLSGLAMAIENIRAGTGKVEGVNHGESGTHTRLGIVELVNLLSDVPQDFVLVLDDYHVIEVPQIHQLVEVMLEFPPRKAHLVIASRSVPPLPLAVSEFVGKR